MRQRSPESLLVVSPCSATKAKGNQSALWGPESANLSDPPRSELIPARQLYQGAHHKSVIASIDRLRSHFSYNRIEVMIVSAGYGLVAEWDGISNYDVSFDRMSKQESIDLARKLEIRSQLSETLKEYKYVLFLLSAKYLSAVEAPFGVAEKEIYLASGTFNSDMDNVSIARAGVSEAKLLGVAPRMAKAELFNRFSDLAIVNGLLPALTALESGSLIKASQR